MNGEEQLQEEAMPTDDVEVAPEAESEGIAEEEPAEGDPSPAVVRRDRRAKLERRSSPRFPFTATADVIDLGSQAQLTARTSDISLGGCFVDAASPFTVGTAVKVRLRRERKTFVAAAVVTGSMPSMGMGLKFTEIEAQQLEVLESWLAELRGDLPQDFHTIFDDDDSQAGADEVRLKAEHQYILNELIVALMRKGVLTEPQGKELLRRLLL